MADYKEFLDSINREAYHAGEYQWEEDGYTVTRTYHYSPPGCHSSCGLLYYVKDGKVEFVEGDPLDPCANGRLCMRCLNRVEAINHPDRLKYPMKRAGERGENKWERITWDEAYDIVERETRKVWEEYGPESILCTKGTARGTVWQLHYFFQAAFKTANVAHIGFTGYACYLPRTCGCIAPMGDFPIVDASQGHPDRYMADEFRPPEVLVVWGNEPLASNADGYIGHWLVQCVQMGSKIISIDPRLTWWGARAEYWLPVRPGTDAALVAGIAHELIASGLVDVEFLHKYCVGYDEETLPEGAPANSSYYAYIMGTGYDMVEKTPAWAAAITQMPEQRIIDLAHEIGEAKPCFICQGWGPQRRTNGETAARAIALLPQLVGQVGLPSTNSGLREGNGGFSLNSLPTGDNPITAKFPNYLWPEAIKFGTEMTATKDGIKNADALPAPVKFLVNYGNNMPANQNGDINYTTDVLKDESLCEFILCYDVVMTDSAKYADIILPDLTPQETWTLSTQGENNDTKGIWFGQPTASAKFERREVYEVCADLADRLGVKDAYTDGGKTREDWCRELYEEFRAENPDAPTWEEGLAAGIYKKDIEVDNATDPFIEDPAANPLETATGKIQIYSPELAELAATWQIAEGDVISPIPQYVPGFNGPDANTEEYPLQITGYHTKAHTHSSYANNQIIQDAHRHNVWINPLDAAERNIETGDMVRVFNDHGEILIEAKVTDRIMPGVGAIPQGMWHDADMDGDRVDKGGCINTLTSRHCTPVAKATGQHSIIGQIAKA